MGSSALVLDINGNIERVPGMDETERRGWLRKPSV